jgi:hypothetical protein
MIIECKMEFSTSSFKIRFFLHSVGFRTNILQGSQILFADK